MKPIKIGRGILDQISKPIEYKKLTTEDVKDVMTTYLETLHTINRNSHFIVYCGVKMLTVMDLMIERELLLKSHNKNSKEVRILSISIFSIFCPIIEFIFFTLTLRVILSTSSKNSLAPEYIVAPILEAKLEK